MPSNQFQKHNPKREDVALFSEFSTGSILWSQIPTSILEKTRLRGEKKAEQLTSIIRYFVNRNKELTAQFTPQFL